eukprot:scaffold3704_cov41-Attheya_sp.AAC.2
MSVTDWQGRRVFHIALITSIIIKITKPYAIFRETMEVVLGMIISLQTRHALCVEHATLAL